MTLHLSLRCAVKRSGKAEEERKREKTPKTNVPLMSESQRSLGVARLGEKKKKVSLPSVIVSVVWFLCENDG